MGLLGERAIQTMPSDRELDHIYLKYQGRCTYCAFGIIRKVYGLVFVVMKIQGAWEIEHWVPKARTPENQDPDRFDNLVPSCWECNDKKGTMTGEEFIRDRYLNGQPIHTVWKIKFDLEQQAAGGRNWLGRALGLGSTTLR